MNPRTAYPAGVPCWVDTTQPDLDAAADFYGGLFGWTFERRTPPQAPVQFSMGRLDGLDVAGLVSPTPGSGGEAGWNTYVVVDSVDRALELVRGHGGTLVDGPSDVPHAGRGATALDPAGAAFSLWESHGRIGAQVVNAPGSWNWSNLATKDPAAALDFYGAVFGWVALGADAGGDDGSGPTMLTRPGYADAQSEHDPELRARHAAGGVPAGFSDAIAWLVPTDDRPPAWDVTFAVADTDAVATRATSLGATLLEPPHDLGPTRLAVVQDPQGAIFTISHWSG